MLVTPIAGKVIYPYGFLKGLITLREESDPPQPAPSPIPQLSLTLFPDLYNYLLIALFLSSLSFCGFSQDSTLVKAVYAGGFLIVPENESWELDRVFINDGKGYNILIRNENFSPLYQAGDTIKAPYYLAEMELLNDKNMVQYQFSFKRK